MRLVRTAMNGKCQDTGSQCEWNRRQGQQQVASNDSGHLTSPLGGVTVPFGRPEACSHTSWGSVQGQQEAKQRLIIQSPWRWGAGAMDVVWMFSSTPFLQRWEATYDIGGTCLRGSLPFLFRLLMGPTAISVPRDLPPSRDLHSLKIS